MCFNRTTFSALKAEYLSYFRDITLLREKHQNNLGLNARRRATSPPAYSKRKRTPSPSRWERKARSPSPQRWERKPISPSPEHQPRRFDTSVSDYPRGCIVFLKRFDPRVSPTTLKTLLQAILEKEEIEAEQLQYVDHTRNVDSVRFSVVSCLLNTDSGISSVIYASEMPRLRHFSHPSSMMPRGVTYTATVIPLTPRRRSLLLH